jgi:hypothetical protein
MAWGKALREDLRLNIEFHRFGIAGAQCEHRKRDQQD